MTSTGTGQGNSSDEEDNEIALAPRLSRASRNLLLGNVDSADESDVLPNNATSDDAITNKDYRREPVASVCNGPTTRTHRVNGSTSPRDTATQELPDLEEMNSILENSTALMDDLKSDLDLDLINTGYMSREDALSVSISISNGSEIASLADFSASNALMLSTMKPERDGPATWNGNNGTGVSAAEYFNPKLSSEILKQQTEPLYTNLTLKKSGADIDLFKQPEDHEEYEYIGPRKSKQDLNLAVNDDDGDDKSDSSDGFNVDDKEDCCNVNVRKSKQKINLAVDDDQEQYQYVGVRKSKEDMQLATSTKNPEDTDSGTDVDKLFINWVQTPPSQQAKLNEVAQPNRPQPLTEEDVIRNSDMHDGGSSVTLSSGESKSTLWSTCSRETDIGNSGKSSPLFMSRMDLMEVLQKQSGEETPVRVAMSTPINSAATLPFRMLEAKLAALSDESDADGPIMSLNGRRTNKHAAKTAPILPDQQETSAKQEETKPILSPVVALKSTSALNDQPNPDDDSEEEKTSTSSGISHDSQELFARYSGNIRPVIRDQQKRADNVDLGQTSSSSVCFNRSVSVAMFHKDNRTPTTDTENEIEDEMEMKYQKQKKRRQKYSSSSSNNAINSESSTDSYSVASLYPSTQTSTNLDSSEYNSMTLTESTDSGDYSITDTSFPEFTSSEPAAAVTGLSRQDLSPAFIHHVKRLLSLPNLRSEWKDQLTHILAAEDTQADGTDIEGVAESAEDVARIVSQIIQGLMQTSGMSGLRILAETASVVATTGSDIESSFSVASSGGYLPSSDSSSHTASIQESDEVLQNVVDIDSASSVSRLPTLLQLIEKIEQREQQMARGGVGSVPDLAAISHMLAQYESSSSGSESDSDPGNMEAAAAMFVFNLVLTVVDRSLHEGQQADDVHYIPEVNNTEPHVEEDSCAGVGSLPAMFQSPSQLLAKHEQQQSLDPATMDAQSWNTRQANIRKHCSNAAVLPSNILRTRLADRIAARPSLLEEKYLSLPPPAKDMMAANSKSEGKLTIDCHEGTSIFKPEESKSVASIPLGSPGEVQAPQNSTPPHSMNEKKYQSVATWLVKSPEQNEIFRSEKDFDLGSVDIMKVEAATEDSSDGNPRPHKHQVIESQKNEADNDSLTRKPSRAFSITRNPSYCEKEDLGKDGSNRQSNDQATNYQTGQIVTTNDVRNNNIPAPDIKSAVNEYFLTDRTFVAPTRTQIEQPVITGDHPKGLVVNGVNLDYLGLKSPYYQPHEKAKTAPKPASPSLAARYLSDLQNDQMTVSDLKTKTQPGYSSHKAPCSLPFSDASRFRGDASCNHDVMTLSMLKEPQRSPHSSPRTSPCSSPRGQSVSVPFTATATSENARFREGTPTDVRSLLVEKEMFESRLRALQMENSTLKAENKLNNEKLSRAQARCQYLEAQLRASEDDSSTLRHRHDNELSALTIRSRDRTMRDRQDLQDQVVRLTRDLEVTRAQNALLEKQLEAVRGRPSPGTDRSKVIDSFKVEVAMLKEELKKARELLADCDLARRQEGDKRKEAAIQVIRLTEVTALLRQQLENTGSGSVADRQVQSLERRLKITEDRLHQERADRAAKLSEVEGRLITENATLQTRKRVASYTASVTKSRSLTEKYRDARSEIDRLEGALCERPRVIGSADYKTKMAAVHSALGSKKHAEELSHIHAQLQQDEGFDDGRHDDMIWLLWHQREEAWRRLSQWERSLDKVGVDPADVTAGLESLQSERLQYSTELDKYREIIDDAKSERCQFVETYENQVANLTREKHATAARVKDLEDINAALTAENDALKHGLHQPQDRANTPNNNQQCLEAQLESVRSELRGCQGELHQALRTQDSADTRLRSLAAQLEAKTSALGEALGAIEALEGSGRGRGDEWRQAKIDTLHVELRGCQSEARLWQDKYHALKAELDHLEDEHALLQSRHGGGDGRRTNTVSPRVGDATDGQESHKLSLETSLHEKDAQILTLTIAHNASAADTQRSHQRLLVEQQHTTELTQQLDQLQAQLRQKTRLMDQLASAEGDYQVEQQALRENLAAVNREMAMKNQQLKSASLELAREQDKTAKLTSDLEQREKLLSEDIAGLVHKGALTSSLYSDAPSSPRTVLTQAEMRVRMVEYEKETLNADIEKANGAISSLVRENSELSARVLELKQELVSERALLSQAAADKAELEQKQRVLHEEHAAAVRQRALLEQDLVRHETTTNQVIERLEQEAKAANQEWGEKYSSLDTDGKRLAVELGTSRRLLEAREKEIDVLRDTVFRQKQEINALQRRAAILGEENSVCRDDVDKLTKELTVKLKQHAASLETNKSITTDRSSLLQQKYDVEKSAGQVKLDLQRVTLERDELRRKSSLCEERLQSTEQQLLDHRTKVVSLETSAQYEAQASVTMATEASEARGLVERVNAELRGMMAEQEGGDNSGLFEEKSTKRDLRGELTLALHQIEVIRQDYTAYTTNLTAERNTVDMLKTKCRGEEDRCCHLEDQAKLQAAELDTLRGHLVETKRTVDTLRADKQTLFSEVQDLTRQLTHKEETITGLELRCEQTVDSVRQERTSERVQSTQEKHQLQDQLDRARLELEQTQDTLSQKERQLEVYYRTSRDLHNETRAKSEVETQLSQAQTDLSALNLRITALTADNSRLQETLKNTLDNLESSRETVASLREQLREQREESTAEIRALRTAHTELQHRTDTERGDLQEKHSQTQASLRAAEASLAASTETKESLQENVRQLGASVDTLKAQVSEETTARRLAEQRADGLQGQLGDTNAKKATAGEKIADLQSQLSRLESELSIEREKYRKMKRDFLETQNSSTSQERQLQTLTMQIAELQAECASLQSQLENQKQNLTGKNKRLVLELKQQTEVHDKERSKLVYESQQLSSDLERLRDQLAAKSRECLRLQEAQLGTEAELRDATRSARTATDALRGHEGERGTLETRNMELELLLAKLRSKDSDDASFETTRLEVTRMLSELGQRMQSQMDQQRTTDSEARARDTKKMDDLRSKLVGVEASLSQEQAMHIVTRTQASSLEEDNQRLRQQLQIVRRRLAHSGDSSGTERTKSRLEEINEIIARSQTRAQQLLASGAYTDGKLGVTGAQAGRRSMSPSDHR